MKRVYNMMIVIAAIIVKIYNNTTPCLNHFLITTITCCAPIVTSQMIMIKIFSAFIVKDYSTHVTSDCAVKLTPVCGFSLGLDSRCWIPVIDSLANILQIINILTHTAFTFKLNILFMQFVIRHLRNYHVTYSYGVV